MNVQIKFLILPALLASHVSVADTVFDTVPLWNEVSAVGSWGNPNTATYGQSFIAPADPILTRFDFYIRSGVEQNSSFKPFVMEWDGPLQGSGGSGDSMVWLGTSMSLLGTGEFQQVTINVPFGAATLVPGLQYVIGLTVTDPSDYDLTDNTSVWGLISGHADPGVSGGGGFQFDNGGNEGIPALSGAWDTFSDFGDLAFRAEFSSAVPEPGTYAAGTLVLGVLGWTYLRCNRR